MCINSLFFKLFCGVVLHTLNSFIVCNSKSSKSSSSKPNIIFMFADDWGFNDVGYYKNTDTRTPFINTLATSESIILTNNYVTPLCSMSRAVFLTGRYPFRYGLQFQVVKPTAKYALTLQESLISEEFSNNGYSTHMIGKWHVGMIAKEYTPNYRGFDTFNGFYLSGDNYYNHTESECSDDNTEFTFMDLRTNMEPASYEYTGMYGPYLERDNVINILKQESQSQSTSLLSSQSSSTSSNKPFFMYIGWQASHAPSESPTSIFKTYNVGEHKISKSELHDTSNVYVTRYNMQAQTTSLDDVMKDVVDYLKESKLWDETLIVFLSDNGGDVDYGDNSPLRGAKESYWEGGIRVSGFITGGALLESKRGTKYNGLIYVTDWYPTLLSYANIDYQSSTLLKSSLDTKLDGIDLSTKLLGGTYGSSSLLLSSDYDNDNGNGNVNEIVFESESLLTGREIVYTVYGSDSECDFELCGAIRVGDWKLLVGFNNVDHSVTGTDAYYDFWDRRWSYDNDSNKGIDSFQCGSAPITVYDLGFTSDTAYKESSDYLEYQELGIDVVTYETMGCATNSTCLFNLADDPCEYMDVSMEYLSITHALKKRLNYYYNHEQITPFYSTYGDLDLDNYDSTDNLPPMVDEDGYWAPWKELSDYGGELDFEKTLKREKNILENSIKKLNKLKGNDNKNDNQNVKSSKEIIIYTSIFVILVLFFIFVYKVCKGRQNKIISKQDAEKLALLGNNNENINTKYTAVSII